MNEENIMKNIYMAIWKALESKLNLIGSVIEGETRRKILEQNIRDKGDFFKIPAMTSPRKKQVLC